MMLGHKEREPLSWRGPLAAGLLGGLLFVICLACLAKTSLGAEEGTDPAVDREAAAEPQANEDQAAPAQRAGWVFRITLPITGRTYDRVERFARNAVQRAADAGVEPVLIFEFVVAPDQDDHAATSNFGVSSDLAESLSKEDFLSGATRDAVGEVTTVACVPQSIQGHAVLAVLACDEIAMAPEAEIGSAGIDEPTVTPRIHSTYKEIASRQGRPTAVALGLVDKSKRVLQVETEVSRDYVLAEDLEELAKRRVVQPNPKVLFEAGQPGRLSGREARDLDLVDYLASNRRDLARLLNLPPEAVEADPSLSDAWRAVRVDLKGPLNAQTAERAQRLIEDAIRRHDVNFICLWIDSPGGSLADSMQLATYLAFELDPGERRTVAYIPHEALSDASLVALACDQLVMHSSARLGGEGASVFSDEEVRQARKTLREAIAVRKARSWSLAAAMIDPELEVFTYTRLGKTTYSEYFSEDEWSEQLEPDQWKKGAAVPETERGKTLQVDGRRAFEYRLANETVDDFAGFKEVYGLEDDPALLEPGWAYFLIDALAQPYVAFLLLLVGFAAMYAELQAPGIGVGAFLALVCFMLFFWSRFLGHTAGWLEVLLFMGGMGCLLLEVFVIPGFGIFGLGGGLLILASLILASQTFVFPANTWQMARLRDSLLVIAGAGAGVIVIAVLINRWLPHVPMLGGMLLQPPSGKEAEELSQREALVHFEDLLGARGTTTTQLTPSGKARFGDRLVDVIADSETIPFGTTVVVMEVRGNRVLVRAADEVV
ncbi:MAG: NfeD family protein [Planctomycetota bacterium]